MNVRYLLLAAAWALVLVPAASAQIAIGDTTVEIRLAPLEQALEAGGSAAVPIGVEYCYVSYGVALVPTAVDLAIAEQPDGVSSVISPSTVFLPASPQPSGLATCSYAESTLYLGANQSAPEGFATLTVRAVASPNGNLKAATTEARLPLQVVAAEAQACEASATADAPAPDELSTATLGARAVASPAALAGMALAGAVGGAFVGRRWGR